MLTDIFADRYQKRVVWEDYTDCEAKLLIQAFRIVAEQVMPYWINGKEVPAFKQNWQTVHDRLTMELGLTDLSPRFSSLPSTYMGKPFTMTVANNLASMCQTFVTAPFPGVGSPDRFIKERLSFIELAFRQREEELAARESTAATRATAALMRALRVGKKLPEDPAAADAAFTAELKSSFQESVNELNERLRRAGAPLNYHNGFIQIASDELVGAQIEAPFWELVGDPLWTNVDVDMKEALDRRDGNERDAALYAAKALESAIKIISDQKGWTLGNEKGAHNFIDNLGSATNGGFIAGWERDALKAFFTYVRNPLGHGPGNEKMPELTTQQTEWAIEACMSWVKALVKRM